VFKRTGGYLPLGTFFLKILILNPPSLIRIVPGEDPGSPLKVPVRTSYITSVINTFFP